MKTPNICIVGPGVVGQATGKVLLKKGIEVGFLGVVNEQIEKLKEEGYQAFTEKDFLGGGYDYDITMFTVPTPTKNGKIDLSFLERASADLGRRLKDVEEYHLVVVKSTVPPGTTESLVVPTIEKYSGKKIGSDFGACMNPEYLREKTAYEDTLDPWMILFGEYDKKSGDMLNRIYENKFSCPIYRCEIQEAEMQKYVHNLFNAVKIAYHNEMRQIAKHIGVSADKIFSYSAVSCEGMWNPQYGIKDKGPYDGSCLPKDTQAFHDWAQNRGLDTTLLGTVIDVNHKLMEELKVGGYKSAEASVL